MTPKTKALQLYDTYFAFIESNNRAKICALIAVNEILNSSPLDPNDVPEWLQPEDWFSEANTYAEIYWEDVKQEIEKL